MVAHVRSCVGAVVSRLVHFVMDTKSTECVITSCRGGSRTARLSGHSGSNGYHHTIAGFCMIALTAKKESFQ